MNATSHKPESLPRNASAAAIRRAAQAYSVDPLPDMPSTLEGSIISEEWVYAQGQYELAILHRLVSDGFAANKFVHYAPNYGHLQGQVEFRRPLTGAAADVEIRCPDTVLFQVDGNLLKPSATDGPLHWVSVPAGSQHLLVRVLAAENCPATFGVADDGAFVAGTAWEGRVHAGHNGRNSTPWRPTLGRRSVQGTPPHLHREPTVTLRPELDGNLFTLRTPVLGRPVISCTGVPRISSGESIREAMAASKVSEARHDLRQLPDGRWTTKTELGFKYLAIHDANVSDVVVEASAHPVPRRGAFICSDERLNKIWSISAYTLRLCMHDLMIDGIKRDRMPWMGDQAMNTLSNAYTFAEGGVARDGLVALGQPLHGYVNGIADYSLWWLINAFSYQRYFGDTAHLLREKDHIHSFTQKLAAYSDDRGVFRPADEPDNFEGAAACGIFIDWGVSVDSTKTFTALQILWYWALCSAAELLAIAGHHGAQRWSDLADLIAQTLKDEAWDPEAGLWREYFGEGNKSSVHANTFAVLSGLTPEGTPGIRSALLAVERVGTPFMTSFALRGLARTGEQEAAIERIRTLWGGMLDAGAQTFWEEFATVDGDQFEMYGRPFGKSLCHAWSSGPAAMLPEIVLGIRPLADGWKEFEVTPFLGLLDWASAVVPIPGGEITVTADKDTVTVDFPPGTTLKLAGHRTLGPRCVAYPIDLPHQHSAGPAS
ncbi:alpha-L-rhamnosidase C-terminal domain-containing protein [Specibacter cremeus]|uniref:alpha-L-rhamnosidase-related protein n=1 Tax=Specibacter cremeus TaxID=1629051 RepID=UPI000F79EDBB|nr:alpha-L-rhamnosidase C-terminal domain-containing protein [Specibacter cremeus]